MYGTTPLFCEASLQSYVYYLVSPIPLAIDTKTGHPVPASALELATKAKKALSTLIVSIAVFSVLEPTNYAPFPQKRPADSPLDYLHLGSLLNNYLVACTYRCIWKSK
jgi:hypothetical protein